MATANKLDPKKWARAKARAKAKMGGKHSARAMQLAVKYYKDMGGRYGGSKALLISYLNGQSRSGIMLVKVIRKSLSLKEVDTYLSLLEPV